MGNDDLDRLRQMLANEADRRRPGSWKVIRGLAAFLTFLRVLFRRRRRF